MTDSRRQHGFERRRGMRRARAPHSLAGMAYDVDKTEQEWRAQLSPAEYHVLREAGTERPGTSPYEHDQTVGVYRCRGCGTSCSEASTSSTRTAGGPPSTPRWPKTGSKLRSDRTMGMRRTEVRCSACGSHLGHVFEGEGFGTPTDQRYCINGIALELQPE